MKEFIEPAGWTIDLDLHSLMQMGLPCCDSCLESREKTKRWLFPEAFGAKGRGTDKETSDKHSSVFNAQKMVKFKKESQSLSHSGLLVHPSNGDSDNPSKSLIPISGFQLLS